jgi:hypothetical protein
LDADKLQTSDIVLTTYATVAAEFCRGRSILAKLKWFRIVLDESKNYMRSLHNLMHNFNKLFRS